VLEEDLAQVVVILVQVHHFQEDQVVQVVVEELV
jgi:hypothetical protein